MNVTQEIPSLTKLTQTKLAIYLWNLPDVVSLIRDPDCIIEWLTIEREVVDKAERLEINNPSLKNDVIRHSRFVGSQIRQWNRTILQIPPFKMEYTCERWNGAYVSDTVYSYQICSDGYLHLIQWTDVGTVDHLKTARRMIEELTLSSDDVGIEQSFKLSVFYCLEDLLPTLWSQLSAIYRDAFDAFSENLQEPLLDFWLNHMDEGMDLDPVKGLKAATLARNDVACRYFWRKLSEKDKKVKLLKIQLLLAQGRVPNIAPSQFLELNQETQTFLWQNYPYVVMKMFINFDRYDLFVAFADNIRVKMLKPEDFYELLAKEIVITINYFFDVFWSNGSVAQWTHVILQLGHPTIELHDEFDHPGKRLSFVQNLFKSGNILGLRLFLKHLTSNERAAFVNIQHHGPKICVDLIVHRKWQLLKFYGEEFVTSKRAMLKLKNQLDTYFNRYPTELARVAEWPLQVKPMFFDFVSSLLNWAEL